MKIISADFQTTAVEPKGYPDDATPEIAFVGRSNVGKSSMINALSQRKKLARVSNTPGRTRTLNFFLLTVEDASGERRTVRFCDLPGYGFAKVSKAERSGWKGMIETYLSKREQLRAVVCIIDGFVGPTEDDLQVIPWIREAGRDVIIAATKIDRHAKARRIPAIRKFEGELGVPPQTAIGVSSVEGINLDALWERILSRAG